MKRPHEYFSLEPIEIPLETVCAHLQIDQAIFRDGTPRFDLKVTAVSAGQPPVESPASLSYAPAQKTEHDPIIYAVRVFFPAFASHLFEPVASDAPHLSTSQLPPAPPSRYLSPEQLRRCVKIPDAGYQLTVTE